ncbi:antitoxin ParD1/3/4 [Rhizobium fabae]|uniref:Antitoxin ParD1/3/4 n=1 Tax=Rhizobium fabae TaxID=573179 RepID=A0A7W6BEJ5_9HYPH|nr:antitoxin ParD1/3/4 [Rhizobium fabae]
MATMNVSLPGPMKDWVEAQARTGRYSNASDYVRDLIRRDQTRNDDKIAAMQSFVGAGPKVGSASDQRMNSLLMRWLVPASHEF